MEKDKRKLLGLMMGLSVLFFVLVWSVWLAGPLTAMDEQIMQWVMGVRSPGAGSLALCHCTRVRS